MTATFSTATVTVNTCDLRLQFDGAEKLGRPYGTYGMLWCDVPCPKVEPPGYYQTSLLDDRINGP